MTVTVIKTSEDRTRSNVVTMLRAINDLPGTTVTHAKEKQEIYIKHHAKFVPDFRLQWCDFKKQYRVYIYVGGTNYDKEQAGYTICTVKNGLDAAEFIMMYKFLHRNRAQQWGNVVAA